MARAGTTGAKLAAEMEARTGGDDDGGVGRGQSQAEAGERAIMSAIRMVREGESDEERVAGLTAAARTAQGHNGGNMRFSPAAAWALWVALGFAAGVGGARRGAGHGTSEDGGEKYRQATPPVPPASPRKGRSSLLLGRLLSSRARQFRAVGVGVAAVLAADEAVRRDERFAVAVIAPLAAMLEARTGKGSRVGGTNNRGGEQKASGAAGAAESEGEDSVDDEKTLDNEEIGAALDVLAAVVFSADTDSSGWWWGGEQKPGAVTVAQALEPLAGGAHGRVARAIVMRLIDQRFQDSRWPGKEGRQDPGAGREAVIGTGAGIREGGGPGRALERSAILEAALLAHAPLVGSDDAADVDNHILDDIVRLLLLLPPGAGVEGGLAMVSGDGRGTWESQLASGLAKLLKSKLPPEAVQRVLAAASLFTNLRGLGALKQRPPPSKDSDEHGGSTDSHSAEVREEQKVGRQRGGGVVALYAGLLVVELRLALDRLMATPAKVAVGSGSGSRGQATGAGEAAAVTEGTRLGVTARSADELRLRGNALLKGKNYRAAEETYTEALTLLAQQRKFPAASGDEAGPSAGGSSGRSLKDGRGRREDGEWKLKVALLNNRSLARVRLGCPSEALSDADAAVVAMGKDNNTIQGSVEGGKSGHVEKPGRPHQRRGEALAALNRLDEAAAAYESALRLEPESERLQVALQNIRSLLAAGGGTGGAVSEPGQAGREGRGIRKGREVWGGKRFGDASKALDPGSVAETCLVGVESCLQALTAPSVSSGRGGVGGAGRREHDGGADSELTSSNMLKQEEMVAVALALRPVAEMLIDYCQATGLNESGVEQGCGQGARLAGPVARVLGIMIAEEDDDGAGSLVTPRALEALVRASAAADDKAVAGRDTGGGQWALLYHMLPCFLTLTAREGLIDCFVKAGGGKLIAGLVDAHSQAALAFSRPELADRLECALGVALNVLIATRPAAVADTAATSKMRGRSAAEGWTVSLTSALCQWMKGVPSLEEEDDAQDERQDGTISRPPCPELVAMALCCLVRLSADGKDGRNGEGSDQGEGLEWISQAIGFLCWQLSDDDAWLSNAYGNESMCLLACGLAEMIENNGKRRGAPRVLLLNSEEAMRVLKAILGRIPGTLKRRRDTDEFEAETFAIDKLLAALASVHDDIAAILASEHMQRASERLGLKQLGRVVHRSRGGARAF